ncbi:MAG: bacillithiol biosynthesis deacetylase BshB1 [Planctomycetaceae bacterium]|nr:bacillithiol biosynthesis deacetylase BshB1 [Planctomycetaceae bacterium]
MKLVPPELDVLVIAPHPDDAELGMGGSILRFLEEGKRVGILDLTDGEPTPYGTVETRALETAEATRILGISWRGNLGLPNRSLQATLEARKALASIIRLCRAPWLFAPYWLDAHPDHMAATQLVEEARFWAKLSKTDMAGEPFHPNRIYHYYCVHLKHAVQPAFILDISEHFDRKMLAVNSFESQFITGRSTNPPTFLDRVTSNAEYCGQLIGVRYGEAFQCKEPIGINSMDCLI